MIATEYRPKPFNQNNKARTPTPGLSIVFLFEQYHTRGSDTDCHRRCDAVVGTHRTKWPSAKDHHTAYSGLVNCLKNDSYLFWVFFNHLTNCNKQQQIGNPTIKSDATPKWQRFQFPKQNSSLFRFFMDHQTRDFGLKLRPGSISPQSASSCSYQLCLLATPT